MTEARRIFQQGRVKLVGAVLNDLSGTLRRDRGYYDYRYSYYGGYGGSGRPREKTSGTPKPASGDSA